MYKNRKEAGEKLANELKEFKDSDAILLAIPRGGVPVAYEIGKALNLDVDVIVVKKIEHPNNPEYAVGAASTSSSYINTKNIRGVSEQYLEKQKQVKQEEAKAVYRQLRGDKEPLDLEGKNVVLVDDGVATGSTLRMAVRVVKNLGSNRVIVAVPVGSPQAIAMLKQEVNEVFCPFQPTMLGAIGQFYEDFSQVPTEQAKEMLLRLE